MARHPRLIFPGVALHIIQRGNNRVACFRGDSDYLTYLSYLAHLSRKYECDVHAYCLMTNHVHLLLTPNEADACGYMMRDLGRCYVRYFNRRYERTGTLWEGRFKSCLVESARYVLACYRYIELNPVRAGMVDQADAYSWSSHRANIGVYRDPVLTTHVEYEALASYAGLFEQALDDSAVRLIREATNGGYPLVSDGFKSRVLEPSGYRTEPGKPGPKVEAPQADYCCEPA